MPQLADASPAPATPPRLPENAGAAEPRRKGPFQTRRGRSLLIIAGIAAAVILGVLVFLLLNAGKEKTDDAQVDADVVPLAPRVAGQVVAVPIVENQWVKRGDLVLQVDERDYQAKLAQVSAELDSARGQAAAADAQVAVAEAAARGALTEAQANLLGSNRSVSTFVAQLEQARATLRSREADFRLAEINLERVRILQKGNAIAPQQVDQALAQRDSARAAMVAARASVSAADQELRRAQAQVDESQGRVVASRPVDANIAAARANADVQRARVQSAEAAVALAALNLEWTRVLAPGDGVVSKISGHPGAYLAAGQTVAQFVPARKYVTANFKETQIGRMRPGQRSDVKVDTYGETLRGMVESLAGGTGARFSLLPPENATGNFVKVTQRVPVRIALDGVPSSMALRAGQSVLVTVHVGE
jgi:membrane fusion protein (multidrug efflux system)